MQTVFLSLGNPYREEYRSFAEALETKFEEHGLALKSVGYNVASHKPPFRKIIDLLDASKGAVIVAFRRVHVEKGSEKDALPLDDVKITTPWNHIEAAMAYDRGLPLLVLAEKGLKREGLLEYGYDWSVHEMDLTPTALEDSTFRQVFADWRNDVAKPRKPLTFMDPSELTIGQIVATMKVGQFIAIGAGLFALLFAAFEWGMHVAGK